MNIIQKNESSLRDLYREYDIEFLAVFGSTARGTDRSESDVDLLVRFSHPVSLFDLVGIDRAFSNVLERDVDLVTEPSLSK
jgi:predicted nucleotidyltransferase